ncbi:hypothetical protein B0H14DRAFT_983684 [Mycena olivaceomarginata]|nr:hypothetical protein B0H14DRAFT_983684 [Mycena olivaceomarginata]
MAFALPLSYLETALASILAPNTSPYRCPSSSQSTGATDVGLCLRAFSPDSTTSARSAPSSSADNGSRITDPLLCLLSDLTLAPSSASSCPAFDSEIRQPLGDTTDRQKLTSASSPGTRERVSAPLASSDLRWARRYRSPSPCP